MGKNRGHSGVIVMMIATTLRLQLAEVSWFKTTENSANKE